MRKAGEIYDTLLKIFALAREESIPTYVAADRIAEQRIQEIGHLHRTWV
jgi:leucine dehydrogenase